MKQCLRCNQIYLDESLNFCLNDGTPLSFVSQANPVIPKTNVSKIPFSATLLVLVIGVFGIAFGITYWVLQKDASSITQANSNSTILPDNKSSVSSTSSQDKPEIKTTPPIMPKTVSDIIVEYFTFTKTANHPMPNELVYIEVDGKSFNAKTNGKGFASFKDVPCGKEIKIWFATHPTKSFTRTLKCNSQSTSWKYSEDYFASANGEIQQFK